MRETPADELGKYELASSLPLEATERQQGLLPYLRLFWELRRFIFRTGSSATLCSQAF